MPLGNQALRSLYSSPWLLLGYLMSFAFQMLQLRYSSDIVIENSSLIISFVLITSSIAQCGIPAKVYYEYVNYANISDQAFTDQITSYLSGLILITTFLSIATAFPFIIAFGYAAISYPVPTFIFSAIYFVTLPLNQLYTGIYYAQGRAQTVSLFILLEPLSRFLFLLCVLTIRGGLSTTDVVLIYSLSSVLQFGVACFVDSEYRGLITRSTKTANLLDFARHLKVACKCWPYGLQQLISNFSEQFPIIVVTATMLPAASAYFILINRISSLASVLPAHLVKLSLASIPASLFAHITKPSLCLDVFRHPRLPTVAISMLIISVASWVALTYTAPVDLSAFPVMLTSILISVVVLLRTWYLLVEAQFARMLMPTRSALVKAYAVISSLSIFLAVRYSLNDFQLIHQSFYLLGLLFILLSATPIILILSRRSLLQP